MPRRQKKTRKLRGSRTMGYGRVGQHRKAGGRGGKGKAGGRKHFWIRTVKYDPERYSKTGFTSLSALKTKPKTINVGELEDFAFHTLKANLFNGENRPIDLDLDELGYGKLLGRGELNIPLRLRVSSYTSRAIEKIKAAGGDITAPV